MFSRMDLQVLWIVAMILADLYGLWSVLRAPGNGVISTKWGKLYQSEHPRRFWATFWLQLALTAVVFPILIFRIASGMTFD